MPRATRRAAFAAGAVAALACASAPVQPPEPSRELAPEQPAVACSRYGPEPAAPLEPAESRVLELVTARLTTGGAAPRTSGALVLAARELARAAAQGHRDPLARARLRGALARACAFDPAPAAVLVQASSAAAPAAVAAALPRARATHVGAGAVEADGTTTIVVLTSERIARLAPFPREVSPGAPNLLAGRLEAGWVRPRVFVTLPTGAVVEHERSEGREFSTPLRFETSGRYAVEVIGEGEGGPEVAALLTVSAGGAPLEPRERPAAPRRSDPPDPGDDAGAEAAVLRSVNATRRGQGLPPVSGAADLHAVARGHSEAMAAAGRVAHVLAGGADLRRRLQAAGVAYRRAYENVARATSALAAHEAAEESPAHLANVLRPEATRIGIGIARGRLPSGAEAVYLTEIFVEPPDEGASSRLTPEARVREALWRERARLGLPPLTADLALDALARDAALAMRARDATSPPHDLAERALALRRKLAAVDVFVASAPDEATRSTNLRDRRLRRVGVGVTTGDSRRFGAGRTWIAVVYTD